MLGHLRACLARVFVARGRERSPLLRAALSANPKPSDTTHGMAELRAPANNQSKSFPKLSVLVLCLLSVFFGLNWHTQLAQRTLRFDNPKALSLYEADFLCFYSAGKLASTRMVDVYHHEKLWAEQSAITSNFQRQNPQYLFAYPPMIAALMAPLAKLPYLTAYYIFVVLSLSLVAASIAL